MKKIRKLRVYKWSSALLTVVLIWTFSLHDLHHVGEDEQLTCDICDNILEVSDVSIHCAGPCNDPSHHHHDNHSSPDHSDNCIVCLGSGIAINTSRLIPAISPCLKLSYIPSRNEIFLSIHLASVSPRGPPVGIVSTI